MDASRLRFSEMWQALLAQLKGSARLTAILQGGHVYLEGSDYSQPEAADTVPWGRVVLVPTARIWDDSVGTGPTREISFLTRAEAHWTGNPEYNVQKTLDGLQDEITAQFFGFVVPRLTYIMGASHLWLARPSQPLPLWDNDRAIYFTSAEWRMEVTSPT